MTMKLGGLSGQYDPHVFAEHVQALGSRFPNFVFIAVVDCDGKLVAYTPAEQVRRSLSRSFEDFVYPFVDNINLGDAGAVSRLRGMTTETVETTTAVTSALEEMSRLGVDRLIVTSGTGKIVGIVERGRLLSELVTALVA